MIKKIRPYCFFYSIGIVFQALITKGIKRNLFKAGVVLCGKVGIHIYEQSINAM